MIIKNKKGELNMNFQYELCDMDNGVVDSIYNEETIATLSNKPNRHLYDIYGEDYLCHFINSNLKFC